MAMIEIDGSFGEGGGQILRTSLSLSIITGKPFRLRKIRHNRAQPGLAHQHLTAVRSAAEISRAAVEGATLRSTEIVFTPQKAASGSYRFSVGTAGSAMLVFQTVLWPLVFAGGESIVVIDGGTHAEGAPPYEFIIRSFLPAVRRMGVEVELSLERAGFYPMGGGEVTALIKPADKLEPFVLESRGPVELTARSITCGLPSHVGGRELNLVARHFNLQPAQTIYERMPKEWGAGNVLYVEARSEGLTEVVTAFGKKGKPAEAVAEEACIEADRYLQSGAPIGEHLADQLIIPCGFASGSRYVVANATLHATTNAKIAELFGALPMRREPVDGGKERFCF